MAITKEIVVDKIEVLEMGEVQVRAITRIKEDGVQLGQSYHRHVVEPSTKESGSWADTDISGEAARVQSICNATWTDSVKTAYQEMVDARTP
tara:strand:- start:41 stop:316 length:276 start_codon:yes stop_codon:yes gene_type:complete